MDWCLQDSFLLAEKYLVGLAEWQEPRAGMFAWFKLTGGIQDADQILDKLKEEKVVVVPGTRRCLLLTLHPAYLRNFEPLALPSACPDS